MHHSVVIIGETEQSLLQVKAAIDSLKQAYNVRISIWNENVLSEISATNTSIIILDASIENEKKLNSQIKTNSTLRDIPVIWLIDDQNSQIVYESLHSGINDVIFKPIHFNELSLRMQLSIAKNEAQIEFQRIIRDHKQIELLSLVASKSTNAIAISDVEGKILFANEGFLTMHEMNLEEFKLIKESTYFNPRYNVNFKKVISLNYGTKSKVVYEDSWTSRMGRTKWIQCTLSPIFSDTTQRISKVVAIETDITLSKETEQRLEEQKDALLLVSKRLETTNDILEIQREELDHERRKSDELLLNILPEVVAKQLKNKGQSKLKTYKLATILFTDFKGFTKMAQIMDNQELIEILSSYFNKFDEIIEHHYIEKIKTIGDAYMCAGGLPLSNRSNPIDVLLAALEMQAYVEKQKKIQEEQGKALWQIRIGLHSGDVIAGVIGKKKFAYDVWGDTVNTAARMESAGEVGKVNISGATYQYIKEFFDCTFRGMIKVKNKGDMDMYFVNRLKPEFSKDETGFIPNEAFAKILSTY